MGCTSCKSKVGCDHRKGSMLAEVDRALAALYPTRTWGEPDEVGLGARAGLPPADLGALADELAGELAAATFVRPGGDDEPCDYIYVLCLGRTPCVVQVRDHGVPVPAEWRAAGGADGPAIDELYLRLVIGHRAPFAAVQQVAVELRRGPGGYLVREQPRAGVYDAPLLHRMQKLVAILPAYDLLHLDFGEIAHPPPGYAGGAWRALYGADPAIANYLFYPQPTTMVATTFVEDGAARDAEAA
jgi:hypothetical protein